MGLGAVRRSSLATAGESLTIARQEAQRHRAILRQGSDPIDMRRKAAAEAKAAALVEQAESKRERMTLARVARAYHERTIEPDRTCKHAAQWIASLEQHVPAALWHRQIGEIDAPALLDAISELQAKLPETASRIRQRLETVFDDGEFRKLCTGNPARAIRRKLREAKRGRERRNFAALPYRDAPRFIAMLRERSGIAARALEFAVLTAARTGEVIGSTWQEFDLDAAEWTVPASRMKGGESHIVYLPSRAVEIARSMQQLNQSYVFPSPTCNDRPISNMAMLTVLRRMDVSKRDDGAWPLSCNVLHLEQRMRNRTTRCDRSVPGPSRGEFGQKGIQPGDVRGRASSVTASLARVLGR